MRSSRKMLFSVYIVGACVVGAVTGMLNIPKYRRLLIDGQRITAEVVSTTCHNHNSLSYRFEIDGKSFTGIGGADYGNGKCDTLKAGDKILAYYLPEDPKINSPGEIQERWRNEVMSVLGASLILPLAAVFGISRKKMA